MELVDSARNESPVKVLFIIDQGVEQCHAYLKDEIRAYCKRYASVISLKSILTVPGGEVAKNDAQLLNRCLNAIDTNGICRHSFVVAIGGGAVLDLAGFAAGTAHRGVKLIRIPTTVLAQNDSGVGVKNGINWNDKKNFLGTFATPYAVINDWSFLETLDDRDWISGIAEAVKVALLKDPDFFKFIKNNSLSLYNRDLDKMKYLIYRCAALHLEHIAGGDPFERGSSRPLDFGHWAAHKMESMTGYRLRHGEAVAKGIALDACYAYLSGLLSRKVLLDVIGTLEQCGFDLSIPPETDKSELFKGIEEFREHLGGRLTVTLIEDIGKPVDVHEMDFERLSEAMDTLRRFCELKEVN